MSFWGKLGKIALKAAPIAAAFIPGVGPLASAAIGGLASGASSKIEGGSWKDALLSGGIGAGTGYGMGKLAQGLGPSDPSKYIGKDVANVASKGGGWKSALGKAFGGGPDKKLGWAGKLALGASPFVAGAVANSMRKGGGGRDDWGTMPPYNATGGPNYSGRMRGLGPIMGARNQNFPNLAESIGAGRQDAIRNQPWRRGYDIIEYGPDDDIGNDDLGPEIRTPMPPIYPTGGGRRRQMYG